MGNAHRISSRPQVGSVLGVSTVATFAESTAGVADGAKTGLASLVTGTCFLLAIPFSPVVSAVPGLHLRASHLVRSLCAFLEAAGSVLEGEVIESCVVRGDFEVF